MVSCAACLQPLLKSQRFLLDGTEVFHAGCVGRAYHSKLRVAEQRVRELELQLEATRRSAARVEVESNRYRNESAERMAAQLVAEGRAAALRAELDATRERLQIRQDELQGARNQNAALRAELGQAKPEPQEAKTELDASVQRFGLLELD